MNRVAGYVHKKIDGKEIALPVGKAICVGRNFAQHAKELGNEIPEQPMLFIKSGNSFCSLAQPIAIPSELGAVHFETEIAVLIKEKIKNASAEEVESAIWGYGMALDLTLRDVQNELKQKGYPWEKAKSFDGACPLSGFMGRENVDQKDIKIRCSINNQQRQFVQQTDMLWKINPLVAYMSHFFTIEPGDVVLTGTPEGVGELNDGDVLGLELGERSEKILEIETTVINQEP